MPGWLDPAFPFSSYSFFQYRYISEGNSPRVIITRHIVPIQLIIGELFREHIPFIDELPEFIIIAIINSIYYFIPPVGDVVEISCS